MAQNFEKDGDFSQPHRAAFALEFPKYVQDVVLGADALQRIPIPEGMRFAVFSFNGDFRAKLGTAATALILPNATSTDGDGSELSPSARRITRHLADGTTAPTHICIRAPLACTGSIAFFGSMT